MPYEIETKDGIVIRGIPDNVKPDDPSIKAKVANARFKRDASNPDMAKAGEMALSGVGGVEKFRAGMGKAMSDIGRGTGQLLGMVDQESVTDAKKRDAALMNTGAGMAGNIAGNVAVAAPTMFVPGANTVMGAAAIGGGMGFVQPVAEGESRGANTALGAIGGAGGQVAGTALGRAIRPVNAQLTPRMQQLAQAAQQRGIPLDVADMTGSRPLKTIRDVMSQLPLTADRQMLAQGAKQSAYNRAIGQTFGSNADEITPPVLQAARDRIGQEFTNLSQRNTLNAGGLDVTLGAIQQNANRNMTPDVARIVSNNIDDILSRVQPGDTIPGPAYRALDSQLGRIARTSSNGDIRYGIGQVREALRDAMDNSISAADRQSWQQARRQYANLMTVAPLAARSETGDVSGRTLLAQALRQRKSAAFDGGGELGELGRIGRAFVAEQTPNSGTAQRSFYQRALTENPLTAAWQQGVGGISYPMQSLMMSPAGQRYFSQGILPVTPNQQAIANALMRSAGAASLVQGPQ
jgi:hypothetical protein